jgi:hypothetical protein
MPHSSHLPITLMMDHVVRLRPRRVLDIGPGYGKWGFLVREALDFMDGRVERSSWEVRIDGLDAFPYESPLLSWAYDTVTTKPALEVVDQLDGYDLVILGDVIEHFSKDDGMRLLRSLLGANRNVLVATPLDFFQQEIAGNPYEQHLSLWGQEDFAEWDYDYDVVGGSVIVVLLAGAGATQPTPRDSAASRRAYALPGMARRGMVAGHLKKALLGVPSRRTDGPRPG